MPVVIAMLRGVNVGGHHKLPMQQLRALGERLGCYRPETLIKSGNIVFEIPAEAKPTIAAGLEEAMEREFGFHSPVMLRTAAEMRAIVARDPFRGREAALGLITFLKSDPGDVACAAALQLAVGPEEVEFAGKEIFIYYPLGAGESKLPMAKIERTLGCIGTSRNWNTVQKLLTMAEARS